MEAIVERTFTVRDVLRMQEVGVLSEDDHFELIEGKIVPMQPRPHEHELIKSAFGIGLGRVLPEHLWLGVASTVYLSGNTLVEPDLVIYPQGIKVEEVKGSDILLVVEVALTDLAYDRGLKAQLYARHGVHELWVIDASQKRAYIHTVPKTGGWERIVEAGPEKVLTCASVPGFSMRLGAI